MKKKRKNFDFKNEKAFQNFLIHNNIGKLQDGTRGKLSKKINIKINGKNINKNFNNIFKTSAGRYKIKGRKGTGYKNKDDLLKICSQNLYKNRLKYSCKSYLWDKSIKQITKKQLKNSKCLPDIIDKKIKIIFNYEEGEILKWPIDIVFKFKKKVIWREPIFFENTERLQKIVDILSKKYLDGGKKNVQFHLNNKLELDWWNIKIVKKIKKNRNKKNIKTYIRFKKKQVRYYYYIILYLILKINRNDFIKSICFITKSSHRKNIKKLLIKLDPLLLS
tara:strand:+ start:103 stop:933 length:831 start_codon:yes stop_codon:yes gene_type:complete